MFGSSIAQGNKKQTFFRKPGVLGIVSSVLSPPGQDLTPNLLFLSAVTENECRPLQSSVGLASGPVEGKRLKVSPRVGAGRRARSNGTRVAGTGETRGL